MLSQNKRTTPREEQFIRFLDTIQLTGKKPVIEVLDETLGRLVPPIRPATRSTQHNQADERAA